jgi:hypothetical protein
MSRSQVAVLTKTARSGLFLPLMLAAVVLPAQVAAADPARPTASNAKRPPNQRKTWVEEVAQPTALGARLEATQGKPWTEGVTPERQALAEKLFAEGNTLFLDSRFKEAAEKYREAVEQWDHPTINYNLALALVNLDDPLGAYKHLRLTFKYGGAPLAPKYQEEAQRHLKTASRQVTELEISCQEPGARVTLDDSEVAIAPMDVHLVMLPGKHQVTVTKPGYLPRNFPLTLVPGEPVKLVPRIYSEAMLTEKHRPLPFWLPVAVTGVGATMLTAGVILGLESNRLLSRLDNEIKSDPRCASGCYLTDSQSGMKHDGDLYKTWATVSIVAGSATVAGGLAWMYLNRMRVRTYTPEEYEQRTSFTPIVSSNVIGAMATRNF